MLESPANDNPLDWSPDGRFLLYRSIDPQTAAADLWVLPFEGDRKPFPVVHTKFEDWMGEFSRDGKWLAYQSNESGRYEIYVQRFPKPDGKVQISTSGAAQPRWRRDGKELFYIGLDDKLMAVPLELSSDNQGIRPGTPVPLFDTHVSGAVSPATLRQTYVVSPDGQRFLMNTLNDSVSPITVLLNWKPPKQ